MTDSRLYKWVHGVFEGFEVTACMLLQKPYEGVVVEFGSDVGLYENGVEFHWRVLQIPDTCNSDVSSDNIEFTKYLERIVFDRLNEGMGESDDQTEVTGTC